MGMVTLEVTVQLISRDFLDAYWHFLPPKGQTKRSCLTNLSCIDAFDPGSQPCTGCWKPLWLVPPSRFAKGPPCVKQCLWQSKQSRFCRSKWISGWLPPSFFLQWLSWCNQRLSGGLKISLVTICFPLSSSIESRGKTEVKFSGVAQELKALCEVIQLLLQKFPSSTKRALVGDVIK